MESKASQTITEIGQKMSAECQVLMGLLFTIMLCNAMHAPAERTSFYKEFTPLKTANEIINLLTGFCRTSKFAAIGQKLTYFTKI
jgi:hypothetical protein